MRIDRITVGPFQANAWLLGRTDRPDTILIDPGGEPDRIAERIEAGGRRLAAILNTHGHLDHIGAVEALRERFHAPYYLHPADRPVAEAAPEHAALFGIEPPRVPSEGRPLRHGERLDIAGVEIAVIHLPGHTPGGTAFLVRGHLFAGDTLFRGSIGRTDLPGGDGEALLRSIRERLLILPGDTVVHCGHGPDTTIQEERNGNPFLAGF
ncbi:MAG: MBL fold metallo-hydrolase [Candidatus Eisenbacteria bacterium]|nr:MBL fold metallo-hydrolase [Candidatus Eisenbacteria bacterium]